MRLTSLKERSQAAKNRPAGFDYLRIVLAAGVIVWHSFPLSYGNDAVSSAPPLLGETIRIILPMFFSLSGYLIAASLLRTSLFTFFGHRIIRIVPALFVEVLLSAFLLGPIVTEFHLADYFSGRTFYTYFFNIVGYIHYTLPGVFLKNPVPAIVNGQLWTVPFELWCYVAIGVLAALRIVRNRWFYLATLIVVQVAIAKIDIAAITDATPLNFGVPGNVMVVCFLAGVAFQLFADIVPWNRGLFLLSCAVGAALLLYPYGRFFCAVPLAYATVYLGLLNPKKVWLVRSGDYSYGMYLFGFPVQQAFAYLGEWTHNWVLNLAVALLCSWAVAYVSWHCIEYPALQERHRLDYLEKKFALFTGRLRRAFGATVPNAAND
jgi:peptidoglycan/LPS O-acetylase OafA/YrhL